MAHDALYMPILLLLTPYSPCLSTVMAAALCLVSESDIKLRRSRRQRGGLVCLASCEDRPAQRLRHSLYRPVSVLTQLAQVS